jgi:hypothetical protein
VKKIFIFWLLGVSLLLGETEFADPAPAIDNPRLIVFPITQADDAAIHHVLSSANNVLKFYGPEKVQLAVVAYAGGIRTLFKSEKEIRVRVEALMTYDVEFIACGNTMSTKKIDRDALLDDAEVVTAGIVEIAERIKKGWIYIRP